MPHNKTKVDGRKARWFDCDWNNEGEQNACGKCKICRYLDFLDFAESVGKPPGSVIDYNRKLDGYIKLKSIKEKHEWLQKNPIK